MDFVVDFETSGLDWYSPEFQVVSMAVAYRENGVLKSEFMEDDASIRFWLKNAKKLNHAIWVYNLSFENGIFRCVYPEIDIQATGDILRMVQLFDGGIVKGTSDIQQLSLKDSVPRILGEDKGGWEKPIYEWIRANIPEARKGKEGAHLAKAPLELLDAYNRADVERSLELLEFIKLRFKAQGYDYTQDMALYMYMVDKFTLAKAKGILVDRESLSKYLEVLHLKVASIDERFEEFFQDAIREAEGVLHAKAQSMFKKKVLTNGPDFNPGSYRQLELLFCEVLKLVPRILTPTGRPSFKTKYLSQWGEGGQILAGRAKANFTIAQSNALLEKSKEDGRWRPDISPGTTVTGRNRTFGGLNILALDRRDEGFMSTLLADEGQTLVSIDLSAGEPSVVANFSGDQYYRWATVDGVGQKPKYDRNGVLLIDDIYMMLMSQTPMGQDTLKRDFSEEWATEWLIDADKVKSKYKKLRNLHKVAALGMSYGMGPKKLQKTFFENGYDYELEECKHVYNAYWELFDGVRSFADTLGAKVKRDKYLINPFGFRCLPEPRLAFNYYVQSSVNHLMAILAYRIEQEFPKAFLITCIHDELIYSVPDEALEVFKGSVDIAVRKLNDQLKWSVKVRTGFAAGKNFYQAK